MDQFDQSFFRFNNNNSNVNNVNSTTTPSSSFNNGSYMNGSTSPPNYGNIISPSSSATPLSTSSFTNSFGGGLASPWPNGFLGANSSSSSAAFSITSPASSASSFTLGGAGGGGGGSALNNGMNGGGGSSMADPYSIPLPPSPSTNSVIFKNNSPTLNSQPSIKSTGFNLNSNASNNNNNSLNINKIESPQMNQGHQNNSNNSTPMFSKSPVLQAPSTISLLNSNSSPGFGGLSGFSISSGGIDGLSPMGDERLSESQMNRPGGWYNPTPVFDQFQIMPSQTGYHSEHNSFNGRSSNHPSSFGSNHSSSGYLYGSAPTFGAHSHEQKPFLSSPPNSTSNTTPGSLGNNISSSNSNSYSNLLYNDHAQNKLQLQYQQLSYQQQQQLKASPSLNALPPSSPRLSKQQHVSTTNTITTYNPLDTSSFLKGFDNFSDNTTLSNSSSFDSFNSQASSSGNINLINASNLGGLKHSQSLTNTPLIQPISPRPQLSQLSQSQPTTPSALSKSANGNLANGMSSLSISNQDTPTNASTHSQSSGPKKESFLVSFKDTPSRNLFVRNVNPQTEDEELYKMFQSYGPVKHVYCKEKVRGFIIVSYFDIRHATQAFKNLQNSEVLKKKIKIQFCISRDYSDQGTLVVFNLDSSITNQHLTQLFGAYGQIKEIRETPNKTHHKFIEYYDIRHASDAIKHLNKIELCGKKLRIQHSRPGGFNKNLFPTDGSESHQDDNSSVSTIFLDDDNMFNNGTGTGKKTKSKGSGLSSSAQSSSSAQPNDMEFYDPEYDFLDQYTGSASNSRSQTPNEFSFLNSGSPPNSATSNSKLVLGASPSQISPINSQNTSPTNSLTSATPTPSKFNKPIIPLLVGLQTLDQDLTGSSSPPLSPLSPMSKSSIKSPRNSVDKLNSPRSLEDKIQYNFNLEDVKNGQDSRTSIMIKNIPNRLSQTILLSIVDEHFKGAYDFLYLPIDPHTKVNYGYAFINFINYKHIVPFYLEFNSRKWEKFFCSKVCEITYARIQGKIALIQHLRNTSLGSHNKKVSPIVFVSDISGSGEKPLHLATFSVDVFM